MKLTSEAYILLNYQWSTTDKEEIAEIIKQRLVTEYPIADDFEVVSVGVWGKDAIDYENVTIGLRLKNDHLLAIGIRKQEPFISFGASCFLETNGFSVKDIAYILNVSEKNISAVITPAELYKYKDRFNGNEVGQIVLGDKTELFVLYDPISIIRPENLNFDYDISEHVARIIQTAHNVHSTVFVMRWAIGLINESLLDMEIKISPDVDFNLVGVYDPLKETLPAGVCHRFYDNQLVAVFSINA